MTYREGVDGRGEVVSHGVTYREGVDGRGEARSGEEGGQVGGVVGHDDAAEEPESRHQHPAGQRAGGALGTCERQQIR